MADLYLKSLESERKALWAECRLKGLARDTPKRLRIAAIDEAIAAHKAKQGPAKQVPAKKPSAKKPSAKNHRSKTQGDKQGAAKKGPGNQARPAASPKQKTSAKNVGANTGTGANIDVASGAGKTEEGPAG